MSKLISTVRSIPATFLVVWLIVRAFLLGAAYLSYGHIVFTSHKLGVGAETAWMVPFFIDGIAILGLIGRTGALGDKAKRFAPVLILPAGALSLAANVYAGESLGDKAFGALLVAGFVLVEWYTTLAKAPVKAAAVEPRRLTDEQRAQRAATRAFNAYGRMNATQRAKYRATHGAAPVKPVRVKV